MSLLVLMGCSGQPDDALATAALCGQMRDHLVDLRVAGIPGPDVTAHRTALRQSLDDSFLAQCEQTLTVDQARCAIAASTVADATACHQSRTDSARL